jgi:hypothetical protein
LITLAAVVVAFVVGSVIYVQVSPDTEGGLYSDAALAAYEKYASEDRFEYGYAEEVTSCESAGRIEVVGEGMQDAYNCNVLTDGDYTETVCFLTRDGDPDDVELYGRGKCPPS